MEKRYIDVLDVQPIKELPGHYPHEKLSLPNKQILKENNASWHRSCRDMYKPSMLEKVVSEKTGSEAKTITLKRLRSTENKNYRRVYFVKKNSGAPNII